MEGKIFGIPLVLILLVVLIVAFINIPILKVLGNQSKQLESIQRQNSLMLEDYMAVPSLTPAVSPEETLTPTEEPTLKPTKKVPTQIEGIDAFE